MLSRRRARQRREQSAAKKFTRGTLHGKQGSDEPPEANLHLSKPSCNIVASHSGPDSGVAVYKQFAQGNLYCCSVHYCLGIRLTALALLRVKSEPSLCHTCLPIPAAPPTEFLFQIFQHHGTTLSTGRMGFPSPCTIWAPRAVGTANRWPTALASWLIRREPSWRWPTA